jgi:DNA-binding response OmpR family regulator
MTPSESTQARPTILVVEPDILIRTTISEYLRECGYRVIESVSADDVWTVLKSNTRLDVVFAELHLSGQTLGFSLATELRQTHPQIDVILTSGVADAAEKSSDLCEQGPLKKPYHPKEVAARIHLLLERRRQSRTK